MKMVLVKGAGDLATGVALRLHRCGIPVVMTETYRPTVVRRSVSFAEAVYCGSCTVEGVTAHKVKNIPEAKQVLKSDCIPIFVDPNCQKATMLRPFVMIDATIAKRNLGTQISDAPVVIGLGPGFTAGQDVHAVVETNRGHYMGRVIFQGSAQPNTGTPGPVKGYTTERLLRAPQDGVFVPCAALNTQVKAGNIIGFVENTPVKAAITGVLRGLIKGGIRVKRRMKIGDIDPRCVPEHCYTVSDKALAVAGGVLEAILYLRRGLCS